MFHYLLCSRFLLDRDQFKVIFLARGNVFSCEKKALCRGKNMIEEMVR